MERKRVGVLTFHMAHNYGAMLQAYATPMILRKLGYDGEIINYRFPYIDQWGKVERLKDLICKRGIVGGGLRCIKRLLCGYYNPKTARNKFAYFEREVIPHSKEYVTVEELEKLQYDSIVFGSDQIWNAELTDGVASAYIGDFKTQVMTKKIAYAASCGKSEFCEDVKEKYLECIRKFDAIGVRETGLSTMLAENGIKSQVVLDPTLLLTADDWMEMVKKVPKKVRVPKKYLLVYAFDEAPEFYEYVRCLAESRGLEMVAIAYKKKRCMQGMNVYMNCGPADFVNLLGKADMVVTTSFHGTAFSIIMHKEFYSAPHPKYHERTDSLLHMLHLEEREIKDYKCMKTGQDINWDEVDRLWKNARENSLNFLKKELG